LNFKDYLHFELESSKPEPDKKPLNKFSRNEQFETSGWCNGDTVETRMCHFKNICYKPSTGKFVILLSENSTFMGFNSSHSRYLMDLTGIPNVNTKPFTFGVLLKSEFFSEEPEIHFIEESVLFVTRYLPDNIFHAFHDDLMPIYFTYHDLCSEDIDKCRKMITLVFLDEGYGREQLELYEMFSATPPILRRDFASSSKSIYCFKDSLAGLRKKSNFYSYVHGDSEGPVKSNFKSSDLHKFVQFLEKTICTKMVSAGWTGLCHNERCLTHNATEAVLISRKRKRTIKNEAKLINMLQKISVKKLGREKVNVISMETNHIFDIFCAIRNAKIVIGMHGALLISTIFLKPGSVLIEIFPYAINPDNLTPYRTLSNLPGRGVIYKYHQSFNKPDTRKSLLPKDEARHKAILDLTMVPKVPCCNNEMIMYYLDLNVTLI